ncbi:hypothetical protein GCM10009839_49940 [Catenulispora yoronensis]|uniref:Ig-like domain-containing protein n=1 Tax=Catenulispora yoronensis TaxID=450799 RepID=A0ABP5G938_9ACTN
MPPAADPAQHPHPYIAVAPDPQAAARAAAAKSRPADFGPGERIVKAWYAKRISTDEMIRYGYASMFAPDQVPADLRPTAALDEDSAAYLAFLTAHEAEATPQTRDWTAGIRTALDKPVPRAKTILKPTKDTTAKAGAAGAGPLAAVATGLETDPGCSTTDTISYPDVPFYSHDYHCEVSTDHFNILYNHGNLPEDAGANGRLTAIVDMVNAVEFAYTVYTTGDPLIGIPGLNFPAPTSKPVTILIGDTLHDHGRIKPNVAAVLPIGPGSAPSIWMPEDPKPYDALIRHEAFHVFQYTFLPDIYWDFPTMALTGDFPSQNWWMEATAQWATDESYRLVPDGWSQTNRDYYYKNIRDYLGTDQGPDSQGNPTNGAHRPINSFDGMGANRQYGVFPLAEYLTEAGQKASGTESDRSAVLKTWQLVGSGKLPLDAINQVLAGYGYNVNQTWLQYAVANYRLGTPSDLAPAGQAVPADGYTETGSDGPAAWVKSLNGRPTRDLPTVAGYDVTKTDAIYDLAGGGQAFVDFNPPPPTAGMAADAGTALTVTIDPKQAPGVQWELVAWQPTLSPYTTPIPQMIAQPDASGTASVVAPPPPSAGDPPPYFSLIMTSTSFVANSADAADKGGITVPYSHTMTAVAHLATDGSAATTARLASPQPQWMYFTTSQAQIALSCNLSLGTLESAWNPDIAVFAPNAQKVQSSNNGCRTDTAKQLALDKVPTKAPGLYLVRFTPPGGKSGTLSVTAWASTDASATNPADGSQSTATIATIGQDGDILFTGQQGARVAIACGVVSTTKWDHLPLVLYDPSGKQIASVAQNNSVEDCSKDGTKQSLALDYVKMPVDGQYRLHLGVEGMQLGQITVWVWQSTDVLLAAVADGTPATATITTVGQDAYVTVSAVAGQYLTVACSFNATPATSHLPLWLLDASGNTVTSIDTNNSVEDCSRDGTKDRLAGTHIKVPATGDYRLRLGPTDLTVGTITVWIWASSNVTGSATAAGTPTTFQITTPGQYADLTVPLAAGQRVAVTCSTASTPATTHMPVALIDPGGTQIASAAINNTVEDCSTNGSQDRLAIAGADVKTAGTYHVWFYPPPFYAGSVTFWVYSSTPITMTGTVNDGVAASAVLTTPGQDEWLTFTGTAGNRFVMDCSILTSSGTSWEPYFQLYDPNNVQVASLWAGGTKPGFGYPCSLDGSQQVAMDGDLQLKLTGTYRLHIDPQSVYGTGQVKIWMWSAPDVQASSPTTGAQVATTIAAPTQDGWLQFSATAGQHLALSCSVTSYSGGSAWQPNMQVYDPAGKQVSYLLYTPTGPCGAAGVMKSAWNGLALSSTGTYTLHIDPPGTATGTVVTSLVVS